MVQPDVGALPSSFKAAKQRASFQRRFQGNRPQSAATQRPLTAHSPLLLLFWWSGLRAELTSRVTKLTPRAVTTVAQLEPKALAPSFPIALLPAISFRLHCRDLVGSPVVHDGIEEDSCDGNTLRPWKVWSHSYR